MKKSDPDREMSVQNSLNFRLSLMRLVCPGQDEREYFEQLKQLLKVSQPLEA